MSTPFYIAPYVRSIPVSSVLSRIEVVSLPFPPRTTTDFVVLVLVTKIVQILPIRPHWARRSELCPVADGKDMRSFSTEDVLPALPTVRWRSIHLLVSRPNVCAFALPFFPWLSGVRCPCGLRAVRTIDVWIVVNGIVQATQIHDLLRRFEKTVSSCMVFAPDCEYEAILEACHLTYTYICRTMEFVLLTS